jgi:NodT family efflux transporter outer membrane factor (OMF) lipoprotein
MRAEMKRRSAGFRVVVACLLLALISACNVGPKYKVPTAPIPPSFKEARDWKQAEPQDSNSRGDWWELFGDADLNKLEEQVGFSNQDVAAAEARFRAARAGIRVANADRFPTVTVSASASFISANGNVIRGNNIGQGTFYQLPIDLNYEFDAWGRIRNNIKANVASTQASAADLATIRLSVYAELAMDYFQLRGLDEQQSIFEKSVAAFEQALQLTTNRYRQGVASQVDVALAQTQLDTTRAQFTDLGVARSALEHAIAVLIGKPPADLTISTGSFAHPVPPPVPAGLPSELLERRPDIAANERRVASANAEVGVAKAPFFPAITFGLTAGLASPTLGNLIGFPSRFWSLGPTIAQIAFDAGRRRGLLQEAEANYDAIVAAYRQSVLTAFQEVEDNLAALRILETEAAQQDNAIASSQRSVDLALDRYRGGITTYLDVLIAQQALLQNQRAGVDIRTRRMTASVLLIKALGGGWAGIPPGLNHP